MRTHGKKYRAAVATLEAKKLYAPPAAVEQVKSSAYAKFDESVDVAVRLGVDPKHADQIVRGTVSLPHGTGKKIRVFSAGPKPDTFKDQSEVVATGHIVPAAQMGKMASDLGVRIDSDMQYVVEASELMAKCPSKYEGAQANKKLDEDPKFK